MACKAETPPNDCILNLCLFYSVEEIVFNNLPDQWSMFLNPLNTNMYNAVPIIKSYHATQYILSIYTRCLSYIKQGQVTWLPVAAQAGLLSSCPSPLGLEYHPQNNIAYQIKRALWKKTRHTRKRYGVSNRRKTRPIVQQLVQASLIKTSYLLLLIEAEWRIYASVN